MHDALLDLCGGVTELISLQANTTVARLSPLLTSWKHMHTLIGAAILVNMYMCCTFVLHVDSFLSWNIFM